MSNTPHFVPKQFHGQSHKAMTATNLQSPFLVSKAPFLVPKQYHGQSHKAMIATNLPSPFSVSKTPHFVPKRYHGQSHQAMIVTNLQSPFCWCPKHLISRQTIACPIPQGHDIQQSPITSFRFQNTSFCAKTISWPIPRTLLAHDTGRRARAKTAPRRAGSTRRHWSLCILVEWAVTNRC